MPFVLDASMTMSWCFDDEATAATEDVLRQLAYTGAEVPVLWYFEVANVLAVSLRRKRITREVASVFLARLKRLRIEVEDRDQPVSGEELLPLVLAHGLAAYDAAYLELALRKHYPLATLDKNLIAAARKEGIQVLGQVQ
jgi:predicted nucleic acid-binding protein